MQQQFQQPEEKRYDANKLQQVVELATRLQHQHQETLTAAQIEQMGQDIGLSPEFIRKALQLVEEEEGRQLAPTSVAPAPRTQSHVGQGMVPLSQKTLKQALLPALFYGPPTWVVVLIMSSLQRHYPNAAPLTMIFLLIALPPLLALVAGARLRSRRAGALGGLAVGLMGWIGFLIASLLPRYHASDFVSILVLAFIFYLGGGAVLGGLAVMVRRWWDNRPVAEEERRAR